MGTRVFEFPLNGGQNEGGDRTFLDPGELRSLYDGRLTRDGRIEVRPGYTSLGRAAVNEASGRFYAFDVTTFQDGLVAMGSRDQIGSTPTVQRQIFNYIGSQGWAPQMNSVFNQLPTVSDLKVLYQAPYGNVMSNSDTAWTNGYVCVCTTDATAGTGSVYIIDSNTGIVIKQQQNSCVSQRCCAVGNKFVIVARSSAGSLTGQLLDTSDLDGGFVSSTTFVTTELTDTFGWDLAPLGGTTDILVSYSRAASTAMRLRRLNTTTPFGTVNTLDVAAKNGNSAVIGDTTHGVVWAIKDANDIELRTASTALVVSFGPTDVLGPSATTTSGAANVTGTPALAFTDETVGASNVCVQAPNGGSLGIDDSVYTLRSIAAHVEAAGARNGNVNIRSKLYTQERSIVGKGCFGLGTMIVGGNTSGTDQSYATCINGVEEGYYCAGRWNYGIADKLDAAASNTSSHGRSSVSTNGTGTFWAAVAVLDEGSVFTANRGTLQIVQFKSGVANRKQTAEMQGAMYVAGGFVYYYDRGAIAAESGFLDTPVIGAITQNTSGSLTQLATYTYVATYEWQDTQGRIHRSTPSTPRTVTLTGANDETFFAISSPRSLRRAPLFTDGNACKIVVYRTTPNDSVLFRVGETTAAGTATFADVAQYNDQLSDTAAQARPVLYTQSQKPTANVAMQPCRFVAAGRDRLIFGGLPDPYLVQLTQLAFPAEPMEGASPNAFAFQARLPEPCTGVACPGDSYIAFTGSAIYEIPGEGPQRNGNGEFFTPRAIYSDGGCIDWRSIVETSFGTLFQLDTDKIFMMSPGGEVKWVGQPVRDTLVTYPVIVGSVLCTSTQRVVFACVDSATAPTDGVLLIYDLRRGVWSVDRVGATRAVTEYLGRLAYCGTDGLVYLENATVGLGGTMPTLSPRTGDFKLFGAMGNGSIAKIGLLGTYLGDSTVEAFMSIDDGKTWVSLGSFNVTTANTQLGNPISGAALAANDPVTLIWQPNTCNVDRFALRFDMSNGTDTGGMRMHMVSLEVEADEFITRKGAGSQR